MADVTSEEAHAQRLQAMLEEELDAEWLYNRLADFSKNPHVTATLRDLAGAERRHARHWAQRLGQLEHLAKPHAPSMRTRMLALLGRGAGVSAVLPRLRAAELADIRRYEDIGRYEVGPEAQLLADEEREHRETLGGLTQAAGRVEPEHRLAARGTAGTFRAALFGFNDGVVSNLSLVAGVAGAAIEGDVVLIAGVSGLLAGAFSMASGEYLSVRSQAELYENQIAMEREELELAPEEERAELKEIYRRKGISDNIADQLVDELMADPAKALDTHAREELGINPTDLGSPWGAAIASFLAFALGALIPVLPFVIGGGYSALVAAISAGAFALLLVGALTSVLTGRHVLYAGGRMVLIGLVAAGVTFGIGSALPFD